MWIALTIWFRPKIQGVFRHTLTVVNLWHHAQNVPKHVCFKFWTDPNLHYKHVTDIVVLMILRHMRLSSVAHNGPCRRYGLARVYQVHSIFRGRGQSSFRWGWGPNALPNFRCFRFASLPTEVTAGGYVSPAAITLHIQKKGKNKTSSRNTVGRTDRFGESDPQPTRRYSPSNANR